MSNQSTTSEIIGDIQSNASYAHKLRVVEEFLRSPAAKQLLEKCPKVREIVYEYYSILLELEQKLEFLDEIHLRCNDPALSPKEKLQWKELLDKTINYIEGPCGLKAKVQKLEAQILDAWNTKPECFIVKIKP